MPRYRYKAKDARGKNLKGLMTALDEIDLHNKLKMQEQYLTWFKEEQKGMGQKPLKTLALSEFCRELGTLLGAGVPLVRALSIISQEESIKPRERAVYENLLRMIRQGIALSDAMESLNGAFPPLLVNMFCSAEAGGNLDKTAGRMCIHYSKEYRMQSKIKSAVLYPKLLCGLMFLALLIMLTFVLPQFTDLFSLMDELPLPTRILMGGSDMITEHWLLMATVLAVLYILGGIIYRVSPVAMALDRIRLRIPLIGKLLKVVYTARFARTLSSLYTSGIPIVTSLQIARKTIGNSYIDKQFDQVIPMVRGGGSLSEALALVDGFINKLISTIRVAEETGSLDSMLDSIADTLEYEADMAITKMTSYLEPALIIVMALGVGFIMIAVMMPIYGSYTAIESSVY